MDKSKNDLSVSCSKEGYQTATVTHSSKFNGATFGNLIAGGVIGVLVDASSGANFTYPGDVRVELAAVPVENKLPPIASESGPELQNAPERVQPGSRELRARSAPVASRGARFDRVATTR